MGGRRLQPAQGCHQAEGPDLRAGHRAAGTRGRRRVGGEHSQQALARHLQRRVPAAMPKGHRHRNAAHGLMPMRDVLFVHNNFPGQFGFIAQKLSADGHRCAAIASHTGQKLDGIELVQWRTRKATTSGILPAAVRIEADLIRGGAAAKAALHLRNRGFDPALIIGHPGWGETTYMREIFPRVWLVAYAEYYYRSEGGDVGFDPEFSPAKAEDPHTLYAKNAGMTLAFAEAEAIVTPTDFQRSLLPAIFRERAH